jgi:hypothetical protein
MLTRGADGRLYRVGPAGTVDVVHEEPSTVRSRDAARNVMEKGASADIYSASADIYSAKL